jgi:hypothetical protein
MATGKRRKARKPDPQDRIDDLYFRIENVRRTWSRGPHWDSAMRRQVGIETSDYLEIDAVACEPNQLEFDRLQLTIHSRTGDDGLGSEFLGICDRMRGERGLLIGYLWVPAAELMALAPSLVARQFVEVEIRIRGFYRNKGRIQSLQFKTQMSAYEDWVVEAQEQGWPGEAGG